MTWVNSSMLYLIYCKNFCKCHNVSPAQLKKFFIRKYPIINTGEDEGRKGPSYIVGRNVN
jgi:hypothetical protein